MLEVIIWERIFFVISNGYNGISDTGQQPDHFINIFCFVIVFDAVAKISVQKAASLTSLERIRWSSRSLRNKCPACSSGSKVANSLWTFS